MRLIECVLVNEIKPLFKANPHPSINVSTGRKLSRPAGGPMASQDHFEGQAWKTCPGAPNVVLWCLRHIQVRVIQCDGSLAVISCVHDY